MGEWRSSFGHATLCSCYFRKYLLKSSADFREFWHTGALCVRAYSCRFSYQSVRWFSRYQRFRFRANFVSVFGKYNFPTRFLSVRFFRTWAQKTRLGELFRLSPRTSV